MNKRAFINALAARLSNLPPNELDKSISYYSEIIDDRIEEGMSEDTAVAALGDIEDIVRNIMCEMPFSMLIKAKTQESRKKFPNKKLWITLAVIGSVVWLPLLLALAAMLMSLYISVWSVIISLYAVVLSLALTGIAGIISGSALCFSHGIPMGLCVVGASLLCFGISVFAWQPACYITKMLIRFTAFALRKMKTWFVSEKGGPEHEKA